jgi:hypothetical protein
LSWLLGTALLASVVANVALVAQRLRHQPPPASRGEDSAIVPPAPARVPATAAPECGPRAAALEADIARARAALGTSRPGEVFRVSAPNEAATRQLEAALAPLWAGKLARVARHRLECRGLVCRLDLTSARMADDAGLTLGEEARGGTLGPVGGVVFGGVSPRTDPGSHTRLFETAFWLKLRDASALPPPPAAGETEPQ